MNNRDLIELIETFAASGIAHMRYQSGGTTVELDRTANASAHLAAAPILPAAPAGQADASRADGVDANTAMSAGTSSTDAPSEEEMPCIAAPFVGTFYAKPAPDKDPFVSVGDTVKAGQTVCLIEAMKMMSEVQAPCDCVIEKIVANDGELVSFDAPLMRYREV